jgi:hypothetical protein
MAQVYAGIGSNIEPALNIRSGLTTDDLALRENGLQHSPAMKSPVTPLSCGRWPR